MEEETSLNKESKNQNATPFQKLWQKYAFQSNKVKVSLFAILVALIILPVLTVFVTNTNAPENLDGHAQGIIPSPTLPLSNCQPNAILVNPCRPWIGAAAGGNPGIPGQTPPAKDPISQFQYFENTLFGHPLEIFRDYNNTGSTGSLNSVPLNSNEMYFANRPNTYVDINWKPALTWARDAPVENGGDPTDNANIDKAAASIKYI